MSERNYYVLCEDNCKFPALTKEQVYAAIADATGNTPTDCDGAFISKVRELNKGNGLRFWIGTMAEFNALAEKDGDTLYIFSDDDTASSFDELVGDIAELRVLVDGLMLNGVNNAANAQNAYNVTGQIAGHDLDYIFKTTDGEIGVTVLEAVQAGHANKADRADEATYAKNSNYAATSGASATANYATEAKTAQNATLFGGYTYTSLFSSIGSGANAIQMANGARGIFSTINGDPVSYTYGDITAIKNDAALAKSEVAGLVVGHSVLGDNITNLANKLAALEARVAALEKKV